MSTILNFGRDTQGYNSYAPATATDKQSVTLSSSSETHFNVPKNYANWILFFCYEPGSNIWVDITGATATPPAGGTFASCTAELNPGQRRVAGGTKVSCYNNGSATADIGVLMYAITT
jgi:hypothetical protein